MLYLGQNDALLSPVSTSRVPEIKSYKHENKGAGDNCQNTVSKCESIPKPPYLNGIVTYEDDQTAILHSISRKIVFRSQTCFFAFICISNFHDGVMITPLKQASSFNCTDKPQLKKLAMIKTQPLKGLGESIIAIAPSAIPTRRRRVMGVLMSAAKFGDWRQNLKVSAQRTQTPSKT